MFVTVKNRNGETQRVPESWLADDSPFKDQFERVTPTVTPTLEWTAAQLRDHAALTGADITGARTKADLLAAIQAGPTSDPAPSEGAPEDTTEGTTEGTTTDGATGAENPQE